MAEGDFLPNVNTVGLIISFSFAYFIYMYFLDKKYVYMALAGLAFIVTFFLGSRKSIISLFICVFLMFIKLQKTSKLKILFLLVLLIALLLFYVPIEYLNFISERLAQLSFWSSKMSEIDSSDETRVRLIEYGLTYCIESPILGHGYYSFSQLFRKDCGIILYSHNNFIETFVGGGIIGFFIYYSLHGIILKRIDLRKAHFDYGYLLFVLLMILLFNHFSIVVLQDRFVWLLLTVLFTGSIYYKYNLL
ncbi:O-antigen ligase family protein [Bacteroides salyersiae]